MPEQPEWRPIDTAPEGIAVITKLDDANGARNQARMIRFGRAWRLAEGLWPVNYTPTHWRPDTPAR